MARHAYKPHDTVPVKLLSLGTLAVFLLWLVAASYALAYLVSH